MNFLFIVINDIKTTYQENFSWIDNIKFIRDKKLIEQLNVNLINEIKNKNFNQVLDGCTRSGCLGRY